MGMSVEKAKLYHDQAKHMMTLSTAASAFAITMYEKLSKTPGFKLCIPISLTCFFLSLVSLAFAMIGWASHNAENAEADDDTIKMFSIGLIAFCAGFFFLMVFIWRNSSSM